MDAGSLTALASVLVSAVAGGIASLLVSKLKQVISSRERTVSVRLPSGQEVRLEIDNRLSADEVSALVSAAVRSAQSGDEAGIRRVIDASHAASQKAREAVPG